MNYSGAYKIQEKLAKKKFGNNIIHFKINKFLLMKNVTSIESYLNSIGNKRKFAFVKRKNLNFSLLHTIAYNCR